MAAAARLYWGDLCHQTWLQVPKWVVDADRMRVSWANAAGVEFWRPVKLQQLQARDVGNASSASRARLQASMQLHASGRVLRETWTLCPLGQPLGTALLPRGLVLDDGRQASLFCSEPLACAADAAGPRLSCRVTGTGIGMTGAQMSQVFQPFAQADDSIIRRYGGTGLGLSITSHLVRLIGGRLEATSQPGQGRCFGFEVPVLHLPGADGAQQAH